MNYEMLMEDAMRGLVRRALQIAATDGLSGNHHFYITFLTRFPGVELPDHLLARYGHDMTIVLQHQYWDLEVGEDEFEVSLSFNKLPTRLHIPFAAVTSFADPSVQFGLQFQPRIEDLPDGVIEPAPIPTPAETTAAGDDAAETEVKETTAEAGGEPQGEVVSLDAFRKKR